MALAFFKSLALGIALAGMASEGFAIAGLALDGLAGVPVGTGLFFGILPRLLGAVDGPGACPGGCGGGRLGTGGTRVTLLLLLLLQMPPALTEG